MGELLQPWHILVLLAIAGVFMIPGIMFLLTLQNSLKRCAPDARTMEPGMVWLLLIPLFNLVWTFFVVMALGKSLGNEFRRRGIPCPEQYPAQPIGLAMAICNCCFMVPLLNLLTGVACLVLWIVYWVKIAGFSQVLDGPQLIATTPSQPWSS
jgi:hypothetical protein